MNTINFADRNTSTWFRVLFCLALPFSFALAGCSDELETFSMLEEEALKYGTVSVGAVRVTDYDNAHLKDARKHLKTALINLRNELGGSSSIKPRTLSDAVGVWKETTMAGEEPSTAIKGTTPGPSEVDLIGLRMAALKFVESELEDINLCRVSEIESDFRRVVVSLDCSAWVRGKAGAALVYIDLYPYNADRWCHEAGGIMSDRCDELKGSKKNKKPKKGRKYYECRWNEITKENLKDAFKSLDQSKMQMPSDSEIKQEGPRDWVAFCHSWLKRKNLFPHIVHIERMGKAEYLILAESDYSATDFGISATYPGVPSATLGVKKRKGAGRLMSRVRQLSLAFVAGHRRAGWLFMPGKIGNERMAPTERRLRMVVDIPDKMLKLNIHVHKVFLGPDLDVISDARFARQMANLNRAREVLTEGDDLYEEYKEKPKHYRLIKTWMRNLLHQGWSEEISVDIP